MTAIREAEVEKVALDLLEQLGGQTALGADISHGGSAPERDDYSQVILDERLRDTLGRLNPHLPKEALDDAARKLTGPEGSFLEYRNREFHRMLIEGVTVEYSPLGSLVLP